MTIHDDTAGSTVANPHAEEARQRWGHTDAYKQSQERVSEMTEGDFSRIGAEADALMKKIAAMSHKDPADPDVQGLIAQHYANLRHFYEPSLEMYRGLAAMYVEDPRFAAYFDKYQPGLAVFMREAMHAYCDAQATMHH